MTNDHKTGFSIIDNPTVANIVGYLLAIIVGVAFWAFFGNMLYWLMNG